MKIPTTSLIREATLCLLFATSPAAIAAPTALIDMGPTGAGNVTGTVGGVTYNDLSIGAGAPTVGPAAIPVVLNGAAATTSAAPLLDTSNTLPGWTIALTLISTTGSGQWGNNSGNSNDAAAPYPPSLSTIAATALKDNLYMNRSKRGRITLAGLDNSKTYNIRFYGSGEGGTAAQNNQNLIPVTGTGVDFVSTAWNSLLNKTTVVEWDDVAPVGGVIAFDYQANYEGWMTFMSIKEVPNVAILPPFVDTLSPTNGATNVLTGADLVANFSEPITLTGTGTVTLRNLTLGSGSDVVIALPDAQVSASGSTLTINPTGNLDISTNYAVRISANAIEDLIGDDFAGILDDVTWAFTTAADGTNPTLSATSPADNATDVAINSNLVATFSENIVAAAGNITIKNLTDATETVIAVTNGSQVSISGTDLTINPAVNLLAGKNYAIQIQAGAIKDPTGNPFAGVLNDDAWSFTTLSDTTAPMIATTTPTHGASGVLPSYNLVASFSEDVVLVDAGTVTLRNLTLGSGSDIVITLPNSQVSVSGAVVTINPTANLDYSTNYAVQISNDTVKDLANNPFAGIANDTTWSFTTGAPPSGGFLVTPDHIVGAPTYGVTGTLRAVDVPFVTTNPAFGGPDWPENADDGFEAPTAANDGIRDLDGTSPWEPDGTPLAEAKAYFTYGNGPAPSVTWTFNVPDGTVINAIYATWNTRGTDGITYQYTEGAASGSLVRQTGGAAPAANLVLSWTDAASGTHQGNFERIFTGPITVEGGNGFTLWGTDNIGNAAHIDAVVLDIGVNASGAYAVWSGGAAADIDTNGDGVQNGVAWALGAADPNANAISLLPAPDNTTDANYLLFTFNRSDAANDDPNTAITVEYGNDLVGWTTAVDDNDNVEIEVTGGTPNDAVVVKLKRSTLGATGKIFVRLKVVVATP